ncbi:MAG: hypothetical protein KGQ41_00395 [Alphaproteobacteria bacterium]|nr:hypothetical protein [Alphaproteobacteria bacterium]
MTEMLVPSINSYFAIYTVEGPEDAVSNGYGRRGMNWDLHATATDKTMAISHARMLALQPNVHEVQVKHVTENLLSGTVSVRDIKRCKRGGFGAPVRQFLEAVFLR